MDPRRYPPYYPSSSSGGGHFAAEDAEDSRSERRIGSSVDSRIDPCASARNRWLYAATGYGSTQRPRPRLRSPGEEDEAALRYPARTDDRLFEGRGTDSGDSSSRTRHGKQRCSSESSGRPVSPRSQDREAKSSDYLERKPYYEHHSRLGALSGVWNHASPEETAGSSSSERTTSPGIDPSSGNPRTSFRPAWASGTAPRSSPSGRETPTGRSSLLREESSDRCSDHSVLWKRPRFDEAPSGLGDGARPIDRLIRPFFVPEKTSAGDRIHSVREDPSSSPRSDARGPLAETERYRRKTAVRIPPNGSPGVRGPRDFVPSPENFSAVETRFDPIAPNANVARGRERADYRSFLLAGSAPLSRPERAPEHRGNDCSPPTDVPWRGSRSSPLADLSSPPSSRLRDFRAARNEASTAEELDASRSPRCGNRRVREPDSPNDETSRNELSAKRISPNVREYARATASNSFAVPSSGCRPVFGNDGTSENLDESGNATDSISPSRAGLESVDLSRRAGSIGSRESDGVPTDLRASKSKRRDERLEPRPPDGSRSRGPRGAARRRRRRAIGLVCGVCGDAARSLHFGGISCDSCKAFFRRAIVAKAYPSFVCVTTGSPIGTRPPTERDGRERASGTRTAFDPSGFESTRGTSKSGLSRVADAFEFGSDLGDVAENRESANILSVSERSPPRTVGYSSIESSVGDVPNPAKGRDVGGGRVEKRGERRSGEATSESGCEGRSSRCPPITIATRKYCQACRFRRCVDIGMEISWVTLENDASRKMADGATKGDYESSGANKEESITKAEERSDAGLNDDLIAKEDCGPNKYLTKDEQRQIEDLVDIYRSVFWGVPEPVYHRPALIDFPPAFLNESLRANHNSCSQSTSHIYKSEIAAPNEITQELEGNSSANDLSKESCPSESATESQSNRQINEDEIPLSEMTLDDIRNLPRDPCGVNMYRKALERRPRPWLIRQLMGYTLRFMYVVVKLLQSVGRSLSTTDRTVLLRQGMTGLTFLNSVFTYDTTIEAWPERIFPPLPLVLQGDEMCSSSDQPDYLQGTPMHTDEVATVVASHVLEHQLTFIRGMKTLVGNDYPSMFLLMAIMLFEPTQQGLEQPQVVESIQANYCHLLKQYLNWKFKNGPPPNPGDGRSGNFAHTCATLSDKQSDKLKGNARSISDIRRDSFSSPIPKDYVLSWEEMARNYRGDPTFLQKDSYCNTTNPCCYQRREGMYFSPPYPPSPIHPKSIFPLLLTRLSDLQQTAYGYSSTPFLLQGTEVDEIGNLVARIEVFMSDLIASGPKSPNNDKDGNGGPGSGNAGVSGDNAGNKEAKNKKRDVNDKGAEDNEENHQPRNVDRFERSPKNARESENIRKSGEDYQMFSNNRDTNWITSAEDHESSQESCSSRGDYSYSGSSLSVMSIGSSIDDIVEALVSEEDGSIHAGRESKGKELSHSLGIWEMERGSEEMQDTVTVDSTLPRRDNDAPETSRLCKSDTYGSMVSEGTNVEHPQSHLAADIFSCSGHCGWMREQNPRNLSLEYVHQDVNKDESLFDPHKYGVNNREIALLRSGTLEMCDDGIVKRNTFRDNVGRTFETQNRSNFWCDSQNTGTYPSNAESSHEGSDRVSLWNRIKATGRALLRLDSLTPLPSACKPEVDLSQTGVLLEDRRDRGYILEDQIERPESNSSGYVSTLSSPPPQMNALSDNGEFDPFGCASDWDDILQRL